MDAGWIRLHRKIRDNWLWPGQKRRRYSEFEAWVDLLLSANHKESKVLMGQTLVTVERGWILTSQIGLAKRWGWNRKRVVSFLSVLKGDRNLDIQTTVRGDNGYTILSLCNYSRYQDTENSAPDNQPDKLGTFSGHSRDIYNKDKNEKKKKEEILSGKPDSDSSSIFAEKTIRRLNELAGTSFRPHSKVTVQHIHARILEGYTIEDFETVLESKWQEWKDNPDKRKFFRPQTLFSPEHFETYLQAAKLNCGSSGTGATPKVVRRDGGMVIFEDGSSMTVGAYERRKEVAP